MKKRLSFLKTFKMVKNQLERIFFLQKQQCLFTIESKNVQHEISRILLFFWKLINLIF